MHAKLGWAVLGGLTFVVVGTLQWQRMTRSPLSAEIEVLRHEESKLGKLRDEQKRLAALQVSPAELERLRADRVAVEKLRKEIDALRVRQKAVAETSAQPNGEGDQLVVGKIVPAAEWRNAGSSTAPAALETALWAAAGGDVNGFASLLLLNASARRAAQTLLDSLPAETRASYTTPEQLLAFLTIKDVPLGSAEVREWSGTPESSAMMATVLLSPPDGPPRDVSLPLFRHENVWKLLVQEGVVAKYAAILKGQPAAK
jgi:hypothetical protein